MFFLRKDLDRGYVFGLGSFLAIGDCELHLLAFGKRLKAVALDCTEVHKYIRALFLFDKTEALRIIEPLYGSCNFRNQSLLTNISSIAPQRARSLKVLLILMRYRTT